MKFELKQQFRIESARFLPHLPESHPCRRIHGHSFRVEISVEGEMDQKMGWLYDHAEIGKATKEIIEKLDHRYLNDIPGLENPTFENLAIWIWNDLKTKCPDLCEVVVHETASVRCSYRGE